MSAAMGAEAVETVCKVETEATGNRTSSNNSALTEEYEWDDGIKPKLHEFVIAKLGLD